MLDSLYETYQTVLYDCATSDTCPLELLKLKLCKINEWTRTCNDIATSIDAETDLLGEGIITETAATAANKAVSKIRTKLKTQNKIIAAMAKVPAPTTEEAEQSYWRSRETIFGVRPKAPAIISSNDADLYAGMPGLVS